jgi:hypothetical protein
MHSIYRSANAHNEVRSSLPRAAYIIAVTSICMHRAKSDGSSSTGHPADEINDTNENKTRVSNTIFGIIFLCKFYLISSNDVFFIKLIPIFRI